MLAPWDPPDRLSRLIHRAAPEVRRPPDYLVPLNRTFAVRGNGSVTNLHWLPTGVARMRRELRAFAPDVVHVHEPVAPMLGWGAVTFPEAPVVGTFHAYSTNKFTNGIGIVAGGRRRFNRMHARIAVSEAAAWTGQRFFGGRYEVIPNGVDTAAPPAGPKPPSDELRVLFVGRAEERKGLPVLLAAFGALVEHERAKLTVIGVSDADVRRYVADPEVEAKVDARGRVPAEELWRTSARVRCALRAVAHRRELRDDPHRGLRGRHAGDRLQHRGIRRRGHRGGRRRARAARRIRSDSPRSCRPPVTSPSACGAWAKRRANRPSAMPGPGSPSGSSPSTSVW